jgi:protein-disulfide isomerase
MKDEKKAEKSRAPMIGLAAVCIICAFALGYMVKDLVSKGRAKAAPAPAAQPATQEGTTLGARFKSLEDAIKQDNQQTLATLRQDIRRMAFDRRVSDLNSDLPVQLFNLEKLHGLPVTGPPNAIITLVEFSDFECPYCARMALYLGKLIKENPDQIRLIFIDRPLTSIHPYSYTAHEAVAEAMAEGKFWEFYDYLFTNQGTLFPPIVKDPQQTEQNLKNFRDKLVEAAGTLGMDKNKMAQCLNQHTRKAELDKRIAIADKLNINSTPTVYSNAYFLVGDPSMLSKMIQGAVKLQ